MDFTLLIIYKSEYNGIKRFIAFNGSTLLQNHRVFKSYIFTLYCPLSPLCQQSSQKNFFIPCTGYPIFVTEFTTSNTILFRNIKLEKSEYAVTSNELKNQFDIPIQLFLSCIGYQ